MINSRNIVLNSSYRIGQRAVVAGHGKIIEDF